MLSNFELLLAVFMEGYGVINSSVRYTVNAHHGIPIHRSGALGDQTEDPNMSVGRA